VLTAYDAPTARIVTEAGIPVLLVGDSVGNVVLGYASTLPVTMDEMIHHSRAVRRGAPGAFVVGDMPFLSYQASVEEAIRNAGRFVKEGGVDAVKLEGGKPWAATTEAIISAGIPVMGHLGLTPQSQKVLGGMRVQGTDVASAHRLVEDARGLEEVGAFALVLECVPVEVSKMITETLEIPTIGIGAGGVCDGQVLVTQDLLGFDSGYSPRFVRRYAEIERTMREAFRRFQTDVKEGRYPGDEESFHMPSEERERLAGDR
jgi:3-methyl-2-oxobutanoate hydroxymethyltransferase